MPAVLPFTTQFFCGTLSIQADCLAHFFIDGDPLSETAAADNLLFWGRGFFKRNAAFAVKLTHSPFQNDVKVLTDKCWVGQRQLQGCVDPHDLQLLRYPVPHAPNFLYRLQTE